MNMLKIENAGKKLLERHPIMKRTAKRLYHLAGYTAL